MLLTAIAAIPLLIWIYLLTCRGGFWLPSKSLAERTAPLPSAKRVAVVIPARDEAAGIGETVTALLVQDFPAPLHIVVVDDGSTDGTADVAIAAAEPAGRTDQLTVFYGQPLVPGWTGKLWALSQGVARAAALAPDYLLFTDADIRHDRHSVASLVAIAEAGGYDLASHMVKLACATTAEKACIPAFVFFFLQLYPPAWIRSRKSKTAGAAGGCILIRPEMLQRIGGIAAIRNQVIDDCALARAVKRNGGNVWLGLTERAHSLRCYGTFAEVERMISRTAFNQLRHSTWLLTGTILGLIFTYLLPPVLVLSGRRSPALLGAAAWLLMTIGYLPMLRFYRRSAVWAFALPLIAVFYSAATVHSAVQYWRGRGGEWKGRVQDVRSR